MDNDDTEVLGPPTPAPSIPAATTTPTPTPPAPAGLPGAAVPPRLPTASRGPRITWRRSTSDRMVGGVCGGIAQQYRIDPAILRVAAVVGIFAGGLTLLGYAALWLLLPKDTDPPQPTLTRSVWRLIFGVLLALAGVASAFGWLASLGGLSGVVLGGLLVGLGVWLYLRPRPPLPALPPGAPTVMANDSDGAAESATAIAGGYAYGGLGTSPSYGAAQPPTTFYSPVPPPAPQEPREPSYLGGVTLLVALVVASAMAAGAAVGLFPFNIVVFLALPLAVIGAGLLVASRYGRGKWLIIPAVFLALATAIAAPVTSFVNTVDQAVVDGGVGDPTWTPTTSADFDWAAGSPTLDLTTWASSSSAAAPVPGDEVSVDLSAGDLTVLVPDTWLVELDAAAQAGEVRTNGNLVPTDEVTTEVQQVLQPRGDQTGVLALDLQVGLGTIDVRQVPVPAAGASPTAPATPATPTPGEPTPAAPAPTATTPATPTPGEPTAPTAPTPTEPAPATP